MTRRGTSLSVGAVAAVLVAALATGADRPAAIYSPLDRVHPVFARHGMVATEEAVASDVGLAVLERGGNAVDAAVAVGFALAVTLPRAGNLGGGGFMLVYPVDSARPVAIDYREVAPAAAHRDMYLDAGGEVDGRLSRVHGLAIGVPGTVAGLAYALEHYGSMSLRDVIAPAITLAERGIQVSWPLAESLKKSKQRLQRWSSSARVFYKAGGVPYAPGETLRQADLARSLRRIAEQGPAAFYQGEIGERVVAAVQAAGGRMVVADLANYRVQIREPVRGRYRGYEILSMPPPSSGGTHIVQILNILEGYPVGFLGHNSAETIHLVVEAMKRAYADRSKYLGDSDFVPVPLAALTSKGYAASLRGRIDRHRASDSANIAPGTVMPEEGEETTHFSIVDRQGNAVANTYTLNFSYGTGLVAAGTGILLNNEMDDFSAKPGVPNAYGLIGGDANAIAPGKRPLSSMSPTMVFKAGRLYLVTGSPGGSHIITTILQVVMNVIDHGMNIAEATHAVRVHHQWWPDELRVEDGLSLDTVRSLAARGHRVVVRDTMGSAQSIMVTDKGLLGASDPRRAGARTVGH